MNWRSFLLMAILAVCAGQAASAEDAIPSEVFAAEEVRAVDLSSMQGWDIVLAEDAIPSEVFAAMELQSHLLEATGANAAVLISYCNFMG